ncbi:solute carrier organic anion transporter family member [Plakobranchus ocellatus]|uniref:Solute carrier organic anion transporter family member n=1 Tax=Plakobranchus ocellatus TaxID=259542 RepID=A0AAV3YWK3_9GAST|nr:solute carrier organic anion transporter family member [Plakobranchus ocellatus]
MQSARKMEHAEIEARQSLSTPSTVTTTVADDGGSGCQHSNRCGYGSWRPDFLQTLNRPGILVVFLASYSFVLGFLVNGVHNINISSIERRYSLSSTNMGFVSSSFDISASTVALVIGYYGSGKRKPRLLAITILVSAVGSFIMASPHFLSESYSLGTTSDQMLCTAMNHKSSRTSYVDIAATKGLSSLPASSGYVSQTDNKTGNNSNSVSNGNVRHSQACSQQGLNADVSEEAHFFYVFVLAHMLHGVGGTALFTVGASLIDDSVDAQRTPLFLGLVYGSNILGSGTGYIAGGQLLRVYVDTDVFGSGEGAPPGLTHEDTRWVGAWWIGPSIAGLLQLFLCFPLSLYGAELPQARKVRLNRVSQAHSSSGAVATKSPKPSFSCASPCHIVRLTLEILRNPCFTFVTLAMTTEAMFVSGCAAFLPKIVENEFNISASSAAFVSGLSVVPAAFCGLLLGGYVAKHFAFTIRDTLKFTITFCLLGAISCSVLWIRCKPPDMYGVHIPYRGQGSSSSKAVSLSDPCHDHCRCETNFYEPVCSEEAGVFFSPCYAGCTSKVGNEYFDCSCVNGNQSYAPYVGNSSTFSRGQLSSDNCSRSCDLLIVFGILLFLGMCATFMPIAPCDSVQLRCVSEDDKVYAQGIKTLVIRLLGSFTGPIVMGRLVDMSCRVWREKCGESLSCWIYDQDNLVLAVFLCVLALKTLSCIFASLALKFYRPPSLPPENKVLQVGDGKVLDEETAQDTDGMLDCPIDFSVNGTHSRDGLILKSFDRLEKT